MRITVAERDILAERAGDMGGDWTERRSLRRNDCGKKGGEELGGRTNENRL